MSKIIGTDNHDREAVADVLWLDSIAEDDASRGLALRVVERLNWGLGDGPGTWFRLVPNDHRLSRGMEDLV